MSDTVQTRSMVGIVREVAIIVLGILIAFALDAAWDSRQERREEGHIVESLRAEFGQTRADLSLWIQFHRKTERNTRVLLAAMDAVAPGSRLEVSDTLIAGTAHRPDLRSDHRYPRRPYDCWATLAHPRSRTPGGARNLA